MINYVPDADRLASIFGISTAPAFFLGTICAFISLITGRFKSHADRLRELNIAPADATPPHAEEYKRLLKSRIKLLFSAIRFALIAGITATALLAWVFIIEFFGIHYAYGSGILFMLSSIFLATSLVRLSQEMWIGLHEWDLM